MGAFKGKQPELLLTFNEFTDTWITLVKEYYERGISSEDIFTPLELDSEHAMRFSMELGTVVLVIAMRAWNAKRLKEDVKKKVEAAVIQRVYQAIFAEDAETLAACLAFYEAKYKLFASLAPVSAKGEKQIRGELIGFARYTISQCSDRPEEQNADVIEKLSVLLIAAAASFKRLSDNTLLDGNSMFGKLKFIVHK